MKLRYILLALTGFTTAALDWDNWQAPVQGDARSPCPGLNALANHNIIPHTGRNLTVPLLVQKLGEAYNLSTEIATRISSASLLLASNPASGTFTLDDLNRHGAIEHDGSLSREDFGVSGDSSKLSQKVWAEYLGYFGNATVITIPALAAARWLVCNLSLPAKC
jgi:hypothetical protein